MMMNTFNKIVGLTLILGLFLACGNKPKKDLGYDYEAAAASFLADESFYPILDEEVGIFMATTAMDSIRPCYTNEQEAMKKLLNLETWLAFTTRRLTEKEQQSLKARSFVPQVIPIAYDGLAIIVNNANRDTCITIKDFRRILSGEATKWSDVYPSSKLGDIDVVFDNPESSTVRWCVDSILGGKPITTGANVGAVLKSSEVVDWVEQHENAIGIIGSNWLNDKRDTTNVTFKKNITVMKVSRLDSATVRNSWRPYQYYLYNGNYPLIRTIYAILNEPRSGVPSSFAHFCRLPKGQMVILRSGLLPIQADMNVREVIVNK